MDSDDIALLAGSFLRYLADGCRVSAELMQAVFEAECDGRTELADTHECSYQPVQRTGASRFGQRQIERHRRLAPVTDLFPANRLLQRHDEIVRVDRGEGEMTFSIRRADKSLEIITLSRPIWTHIKEIGFLVKDVILSEPDPAIIETIRERRPDVPLPPGLRQLRVLDDEETKIIVIYEAETVRNS